MKKVLIIIILLVSSVYSFSQEPVKETKNAVFVELAGNGFGVSINYERLFVLKNNNLLSARIGAAYFPLPDSAYTLVPITISHLLKLKKGYFESGLGFVPFYNKETKIGYDLTAIAGYRRNIMQDKFFYKLAFTPFLTLSDKKYTFYPYAGFSFGYKF